LNLAFLSVELTHPADSGPVFRHRSLLPSAVPHPIGGFERARGAKVQWFVEHYQRIQLVLPAFPAKSPNTEKNGRERSDYGRSWR